MNIKLIIKKLEKENARINDRLAPKHKYNCDRIAKLRKKMRLKIKEK
jgi:hypothetical protein